MIERIQAEHKLPGSVIVRTAADGIAEAAIAQDMAYLAKLWEFIQRKQISIAVPSLIFEELPLPQRIIRDLASEKTAATQPQKPPLKQSRGALPIALWK